MSIGQTFPDVIVNPDGSLGLVTTWSRSYLWSRLDARSHGIKDGEMPHEIEIDGNVDTLVAGLVDVGFVVKDKR